MTIEQQIIELRILEGQARLNGYTDEAARAIVNEYSKLVNSISSQVSLNTKEEVEAVVSGLASELSTPVSRTFGAAGMAAKASIDSTLSWDGAVEGYKPVAMSRSQLEGLALTQKINGQVLVANLEDAIRQDLSRRIKEARLEGKGIDQMSREIKRSLNSEMTLKNIKTEARTYTATASSYARELTYSQNSDLINGYKWLSTLENGNVNTGQGTCPRCAAMDSQQWKPGEERPLTPLHPNCRCVYAPVTKTWRELGLDVDEMDNRYSRYAERDLDSREKIESGLTDKSYKERWSDKGKDWQNMVIGPKRADLVRSGLIGFNDIVDKRTGKLYTLKELEEKYLKNGGPTGAIPKKIKPTKKEPSKKEPKKKIDALPTKEQINRSIKKAEKATAEYDKKINRLQEKAIELSKPIIESWESGKIPKNLSELEEKLSNNQRELSALKRSKEVAATRQLLKDIGRKERGKLNWSVSKRAAAANAENIAEAKEFIEALTHPDLLSSRGTAKLSFLKKTKRANCDQRNKILKLKAGESPGVIIHEQMHLVDVIGSKENDELRRFLKKRAGSEKLSEIFPKSGEYGYRDNFFDHYCGKDYTTYGSEYRMTELLSMGAERIYKDPVKFWREDPEYFQVVLKVLWNKSEPKKK